MNRYEKIKAVEAYAQDLCELAASYIAMAEIADKLPPHILEYIYQVSLQTNELHARLTEDFPNEQARR